MSRVATRGQCKAAAAIVALALSSRLVGGLKRLDLFSWSWCPLRGGWTRSCAHNIKLWSWSKKAYHLIYC